LQGRRKEGVYSYDLEKEGKIRSAGVNERRSPALVSAHEPAAGCTWNWKKRFGGKRPRLRDTRPRNGKKKKGKQNLTFLSDRRLEGAVPQLRN